MARPLILPMLQHHGQGQMQIWMKLHVVLIGVLKRLTIFIWLNLTETVLIMPDLNLWASLKTLQALSDKEISFYKIINNYMLITYFSLYA